MPSTHTDTHIIQNSTLYAPISPCAIFCTVRMGFSCSRIFQSPYDLIRFDSIPCGLICLFARSLIQLCVMFLLRVIPSKIEKRFAGQNRSIEQFWVNLFYSFIQPRYTRISTCKIYMWMGVVYRSWMKKNNRRWSMHSQSQPIRFEFIAIAIFFWPGHCSILSPFFTIRWIQCLMTLGQIVSFYLMNQVFSCPKQLI